MCILWQLTEGAPWDTYVHNVELARIRFLGIHMYFFNVGVDRRNSLEYILCRTGDRRRVFGVHMFSVGELKKGTPWSTYVYCGENGQGGWFLGVHMYIVEELAERTP
jgi:hypothetical protein